LPQQAEPAETGLSPEAQVLAIEQQRQQYQSAAATAVPRPPRYRPLNRPGQPEFAPFNVVLGEPKLIFSITNGPGDVYQGFLELVGPDTPGKN
jgi:hypothetical protein